MARVNKNHWSNCIGVWDRMVPLSKELFEVLEASVWLKMSIDFTCSRDPSSLSMAFEGNIELGKWITVVYMYQPP